jgi:hypothetical protein
LDADCFDRLARAMTDIRSRRGALVTLLGGPPGLLGLAGTEAKMRKNEEEGPEQDFANPTTGVYLHQYGHRLAQLRNLREALPGQCHLRGRDVFLRRLL